MVQGQAIDFGARVTVGTGVTVLMEEEAVRIIRYVRRPTTTPRRPTYTCRPGSENGM
ncbi:hypothetical protein SUDANB25_05336 [Streptomyces sp. SudanB25_2051]